MPKDAVKVDPSHYKVLYNKKPARVVRVSYGPREKSVMHGHPTSVAVMLTEGLFRFTYPDGRSEDIRSQAGDVLWFDPFEHLPENLSDKPLELVLVEFKTPAAPPKPAKKRPAKRRAAKRKR